MHTVDTEPDDSHLLATTRLSMPECFQVFLCQWFFLFSSNPPPPPLSPVLDPLFKPCGSAHRIVCMATVYTDLTSGVTQCNNNVSWREWSCHTGTHKCPNTRGAKQDFNGYKSVQYVYPIGNIGPRRPSQNLPVNGLVKTRLPCCKKQAKNQKTNCF